MCSIWRKCGSVSVIMECERCSRCIYIKSLLKGDAERLGIYGAYTALVYAAPVLGGRMADQLLGYRNAVFLGGILLAIGEFLILGTTLFRVFQLTHGFILEWEPSSLVMDISKQTFLLCWNTLRRLRSKKRMPDSHISYIGINIGALFGHNGLRRSREHLWC